MKRRRRTRLQIVGRAWLPFAPILRHQWRRTRELRKVPSKMLMSSMKKRLRYSRSNASRPSFFPKTGRRSARPRAPCSCSFRTSQPSATSDFVRETDSICGTRQLGESLFEMSTEWTPVQDRFVVLVTLVEGLVRLPLSELDLRHHLLYARLIDHILRSDLNPHRSVRYGCPPRLDSTDLERTPARPILRGGDSPSRGRHTTKSSSVSHL